MCEDVDGQPSDWVKRTEEEEAVGRAKTEDCLILCNDHKRLQTVEQINPRI